MKKPIFERIRLEAQNEAAILLTDAKAEAKRIVKDGKADIIAKNTEALNVAQKQNKDRVKNFADRQEKGLTTYQEQVRQELVVSVFAEVLANLTALTGSDLLAFITNLVQKEAVSGDEVMHVSSKNYDKYIAALSSTKDGKKLDLLNKANAKYKFTLSKEPTHITEGFLLSGKAFDLIFDFKEIVNEYQISEEQRIYSELFANE